MDLALPNWGEGGREGRNCDGSAPHVGERIHHWWSILTLMCCCRRKSAWLKYYFAEFEGDLETSTSSPHDFF